MMTTLTPETPVVPPSDAKPFRTAPLHFLFIGMVCAAFAVYPVAWSVLHTDELTFILYWMLISCPAYFVLWVLPIGYLWKIQDERHRRGRSSFPSMTPIHTLLTLIAIALHITFAGFWFLEDPWLGGGLSAIPLALLPFISSQLTVGVAEVLRTR